MENSIILTNCGKLGDFLYCLPIASWIYKTKGKKIHWVLPQAFEPFNHIDKLLRSLPFTEKITHVNHPIYFGHGGQPYKFDPMLYGIKSDEYYNLGFRSYPDKFITKFYAEEYGLGWDKDFVIDFGPVNASQKILRSEQFEVAERCPHAEVWSIPMDIYELGQTLTAAKERHLWHSGPATMMYIARIPFYLYYDRGHPRHLYLPDEYFGGSLITPVLCIRDQK